MPPAGNRSRKVRGISQNSFGSKYLSLHIRTGVSIQSAALEVVCPPPGYGRKFRKILETTTPSTYVATGVGVEG
jgi:hypothetical protein